jgi:hypothetical protein
MPQASLRFDAMISTFSSHMSDYRTLKLASLLPIVWMMIGAGIALVLLGGAGGYLTRK